MQTALVKPRRLAASAIFAVLLMVTLATYARISAPIPSTAHVTSRPTILTTICSPQPATQDLPTTPSHPR
jgi:hypothetical protein